MEYCVNARETAHRTSIRIFGSAPTQRGPIGMRSRDGWVQP